MLDFVLNCPPKQQTLWNTKPLSTPGLTLILRLYMPKNALHTHEWYCISSASRFKKKKKIDLPTLLIFVPKGQTNILFFLVLLLLFFTLRISIGKKISAEFMSYEIKLSQVSNWFSVNFKMTSQFLYDTQVQY